jgi:transposase
MAESLYYAWSKEFLEAGKRYLAGDTVRAAVTDYIKALRQEARTLKEVVAEQALELRLLKKIGGTFRRAGALCRVQGLGLPPAQGA